jgi:hypothetical protein
MQAAPMTVRTANLMRQPVIESPACESLACAAHQGSFEASYRSRETFTAGSSDAVVRPRSVIDQWCEDRPNIRHLRENIKLLQRFLAPAPLTLANSSLCSGSTRPGIETRYLE